MMYRNSGWELVNLIAFFLVCWSVWSVSRWIPWPARWHRWFHEFWRVPRAARSSLTRYAAVRLLLVLCVLAGTGLLFHDLGVKSWLFPDSGWGRFVTGFMFMLLYCELVLLSYLRDQEAYRALRDQRSLRVTDSEAYRRTRRVLRDIASQLGRPSWVLRQADRLGLVNRGRVFRARRAVLAEVRKPRALSAQESDRLRLAAAPTVVLVSGWYGSLAIALIATAVVFMENAAYLGSSSILWTLLTGIAGYVAGLYAGWLVAAAVLWVVDRKLQRWLQEGEPAPWRIPAGVPIGFGVGAVLYVVLGFLIANQRLLGLSLALVGGVLAFLVARRPGRRETMGWRKRATSWTYPLGLALLLAGVTSLSCILRLMGMPEEVAWVAGLVVGLVWTVAHARRTRLLTPGSLVVIPSCFILGYVLLCIGYWGLSAAGGGPEAARVWRVVSFPLTSLLGVAFALYFFVGMLLPRHPYLGFLAVMAVFAYMNGTAIDLPRSDPKFSFPDLRLYNARPVRLDSRDYLLSSYGVVVPLDEQVLGAPTPHASPPGTTRIGGGRFVVPTNPENRGDLFVGLPPGYLVPDLLRRDVYNVILRMPRKVEIDREKQEGVNQEGVNRFVIPSTQQEGGPVTWENLQNSALLWAIPTQKQGPNLLPGENVGRYAVFPLRRKNEPLSTADQTPYWTYEAVPPKGAADGNTPQGTVWRIMPRDASSANGVKPEQLYLIGNWSFPIERLAGEGQRLPEPMLQVVRDDLPFRNNWYRLKGAAEYPFYPRLWWLPRPQDGDPDVAGTVPDRPDTGGRGTSGLCLNLQRPELRGVTLQDDLELTLALPRPWGSARVIHWDQESSRYQLLVTTANRWVVPTVGELLRFSDGSRKEAEGGLPSENLYRVVSRSRPTWDQPDDRSSLPEEWPGPSEDSLAAILEPPASNTSSEIRALRVATVLEIRKEPAAAGAGADAACPPASIPPVTKKIWDSEVLSWGMATSEEAGNGDKRGLPESMLLDQVGVLRRWKQQLEALRPRGDAASSELDALPPADLCRCPVDHIKDCPKADDQANPNPACACPVKHKLVLVTTNGGGIRSALWAVTVLEYLERQFGPTFPYHVRLITGASGGMVGATYYTEAIRQVPKPPAGLTRRAGTMAEQLGGRDYLTPVANHMVFSDIPRLMSSPLSIENDRGVALERAWQATGVEANRAFGKSFATIREEEAEGWRPSLVFTPMIVEDGRRLLISNLDFNSTPRNLGGMLLEPGSSLLRPQMGQFGVLLPQAAAPGEDLYSLTSVEFFRLFPASDAMSVGTAARMSATFPLISPAATLPTIPPRSVVDAGYYDNFGVNLVSLWARMGQVQRWLVENTSGVVIIQIRDHASQLLRTELDADLRRGAGLSWLESPGVAALTGDAYGAIHSRGLLQLSRPLNGYFNSRYAVTSFRNDEQIEDLDNYLNIVPMTARQLRESLQSFVADGKELDRDAILEKLPDQVKRLSTRFPYTTVVFECPVEAVLSWDLSNFEAENIVMGMGPRFGAAQDQGKPPLSLLSFDPLNDAQRRELLAFLDSELGDRDTKKYGPLVGEERIIAVVGVWRNLQRLKLLASWWEKARPVTAP